MKVFVDNCVSPTLASTLNGFLRHRGDEALHIRDAPCGAHARDIDWIQWLRSDPRGWIVLTGDARIQKNPAERLAFRQANLGGIVLASAYQKTPIHKQASFLLWRWPDIEALIRLTAPPFMFELPMHRSSLIRQLPL